MTKRSNCPDCSSDNLLFRTDVAAAGGYGPNLLPGAGGFFEEQTVRAVVCKDCGLLRLFAEQETLDRITAKNGWEKL